MIKINILITTICILFFLSACKEKNEQIVDLQENYRPDWQSVQKYEVPKWFNDAKLGIFIHWGPYAVPAYCNEWYPNRMYDSTYTRKHGDLSWNVYKHHKETYGDQKKFGYKDFIPMFKAEKFDPKEWLDVFEQSGAKYIVPVGEHHDGFAMYASNITKWNSLNMGPKRDIAGELAKETRARGLKFGISSHFSENWYYYKHDEKFDTSDPENFGLYGRPHPEGQPADKQFLKLFEDRTKDMINLYEPDLLWFDGALNAHEGMPTKLELLSYYYNHALDLKKEVVFNYKNNSRHIWPDGCAVLDIERGKLNDIRKEPWQTDTALGVFNWGYTEKMIVKSPNVVIDGLIDIVSKNGNLLLNVSPKADGTIPENQKYVLSELGNWLAINGESIYESRPWKIFGEGPTLEDLNVTHMSERKNAGLVFSDSDFRFTQRGKDFFIICLGVPKEQVLIKALKKDSPLYDYEIESIELLGSKLKIEYEVLEAGLNIKIPSGDIVSPYATVFKIVSGDLKYKNLAE
ncbi:alpha-L-fucosidase [Flavivirga rizhaonensis]|uniref:alpha-L-fucosidase n=1 Tax=Flavivirga rizhaonensis TaxID=2559571 RepID=A0A4S1E0U6_9FLAO|nr:alpha-L-fucosidase [Flavivirga rizhaonensis]TGV04167.1 alpha-L-fucosidase [Flavivirga rizhaonensis]